MSELRWILLLAGGALLAVVYYFSRRSTSIEDEAHEHREQAPYLDAAAVPQEARLTPELEEQQSDADAGIAQAEAPTTAQTTSVGTATAKTTAADTAEDPKPSQEVTEAPLESRAAPVITEKVVVLHLLPAAETLFDGAALMAAFEAEGLKFGRFDIFHRYADNDSSKPESLYSVANVVKPGTFQMQDLASQHLKGASMFLVLPGPEDAVAAFADMLATGRRLAATLDGQLLDAQGVVVSRQLASHIREDIINYQHGISPTSLTV